MALNWMQHYAATAFVELADEGRMSRREALARLTKLLGGSAAAVTFLAACSSDGGSKGAATTRPTTRPTKKPAPAVTSPPTAGGTGHVLSVAADDPDVVA